jgi:hypothetical protein
MAQMTDLFAFTGSISNLSAYRMRGHDKIILRTKGGASKDKIKRSPKFANTRRVNAEFGGRSTATQWILAVIGHVRPLADYNIAGPLNALIKPIQEMDTKSAWGERNIAFTKSPGLLEGFNLNKKNIFDSIIRNSLKIDLSRENLLARIDIPALLPKINFFIPPGQYSLYSLVAELGVLPDLYFSKYGYAAPKGYIRSFSASTNTGWYPSLNGSPAMIMEIDLGKTVQQLKAKFPDSSYTLVLSVGVRFGNMGMNNDVQQIRYAGAAKIIAVG